MKLAIFHERLTYYNRFYRVSEELITKGIIKIYIDKDKKKRIKLTKKGKLLKEKLNEILEMIK